MRHMVDTAQTRTRSLSYPQARGIVLLLGLVALGVVALIMYVRRVDPAEVSATMFFLPVFVGFLYWGVPGGLILGAVATVTYIWIRWPAIDVVGWGELVGLIVARGAGYLAFGLIGGWATEQLRTSITKLDLYDQIDDDTGLFNSRSLVEAVDLEKSRATRYAKIFSVVVADLPDPGDIGRRTRRHFLSDLGDRVERSVRAVDHAVHARDDDKEVLAFVLPETSASGAQVFAGKLVEQVAALAAEHGIRMDIGQITTTVASYPDQEENVERIMERFREIAAEDFPESAASSID